MVNNIIVNFNNLNINLISKMCLFCYGLDSRRIFTMVWTIIQILSLEALQRQEIFKLLKVSIQLFWTVTPLCLILLKSPVLAASWEWKYQWMLERIIPIELNATAWTLLNSRSGKNITSVHRECKGVLESCEWSV